MTIIKKILSLFLLIPISLASCNLEQNKSEGAIDMNKLKYGNNYKEELEHANQDYLFGMDYLSLEWYCRGLDYVKGYKTLSNMGVKSIRNWMHFSELMLDPDTFNDKNVTTMHDILRVASSYNFQIIGMNHTNYDLKTKRFGIGKPKYQTYENSDYSKWLDVYEQCWYKLVKEFPEVTYWEIDNEINNKDFMYVADNPTYLMTNEEMAKVSADMLFRASKAIHEANPNAITILGGLVDPIGLGKPAITTNITMVGFLEALYDEIESGNHGSFYPDDFFQCAAWHPYYYATIPDDYFVEENNKIYNVIKTREGKDKKVFLTEIGWSESWNSQEHIGNCIRGLVSVLKEKMTYVESFHYYRYFDNSIQGTGDYAGMFYDPLVKDNDKINNVVRPRGKAKPYAYVYQELAGGNGSLSLFEDKE